VIILDSSFLVSFFREGDQNNSEAMRLSMENANEAMLLSDAVLFETLTILAYKDGTQKAKDAYSQLLGNRHIQTYYFADGEKQEILEMFFSQKGKMSTTDISVLYLAKKCSARILAFDEQINKAHERG